MPRNLTLAILWRFSLLAALVAIVFAIGVYRYDWRLFGEKQMVDEEKQLEEIIDQNLETPSGDQASPAGAREAETPTTPSPTPPSLTPAPAPVPTPSATPTPSPVEDDKALTDFLEKITPE